MCRMQFKVVNDSCGHPAGDELLRQLTSVLESVVRKRDTLARLGGDEFVLLMTNTTHAGAQHTIEKYRNVLNSICASNNIPYVISFSYGIVSVESGDTSSIENLLAEADKHMYENKRKSSLSS